MIFFLKKKLIMCDSDKKINENKDENKLFLKKCCDDVVDIDWIKSFLLSTKDKNVIKDENGKTCLFYAIYGGSSEVINMLIDKYPGIQTICTLHGTSPFQVAIHSKNVNNTKLLFHYNTIKNSKKDYCLTQKQDETFKHCNILWYFSMNNLLSPIEMLEQNNTITDGADWLQKIVDESKNIHFSCFDIAKYILYTKENCFFEYCYTGNLVDVIKYVEVEQKDPYIYDTSKKTGLIYAIIGCHFDVVKYLILSAPGIQLMEMNGDISPLQIVIDCIIHNQFKEDDEYLKILEALFAIPNTIGPQDVYAIYKKLKTQWYQSNNQLIQSPRKMAAINNTFINFIENTMLRQSEKKYLINE